MRKLTLALLSGAYLCLALIVALVVWRLGRDDGGGVAAFIGTLALAYSLQGLVSRQMEAGQWRRELDALHQAHEALSGAVGKIERRLGQVADGVAEEVLRRSDEMYGEMQMLEEAVQQISDRLDSRLDQHETPRAVTPAASPQRSALLDTVRSALEAGRADLYLQAVLGLPQRRTLYYEGFSRLRDETGRVLMPAEFLSVAELGGLVAAIDNLLLFRCVQIVRRLARQDRKVGIFCNISMMSLGDEAFFLPFMEFLQDNRDLAGSIIFELGQEAFEARGSTEARNMAKLADLGYRFSIDKVTDVDLDFQDLARADVRFVKVSAQLLLDQLEEDDGRLTFKSAPDLQAGDFSALASRHGIELVVEKIESERQVVDVLDLDIALGQGNLFGEPRPIREAVFAEAEPSSAFVQAALRRIA
jgi:cyclic-di-GMP phosphodiesterase TipF (flagellum assembly factor)